jgi:hypothetical protein
VRAVIRFVLDPQARSPRRVLSEVSTANARQAGLAELHPREHENGAEEEVYPWPRLARGGDTPSAGLSQPSQNRGRLSSPRIHLRGLRRCSLLL